MLYFSTSRLPETVISYSDQYTLKKKIKITVINFPNCTLISKPIWTAIPICWKCSKDRNSDENHKYHYFHYADWIIAGNSNICIVTLISSQISSYTRQYIWWPEWSPLNSIHTLIPVPLCSSLWTVSGWVSAHGLTIHVNIFQSNVDKEVLRVVHVAERNFHCSFI